MRKSSWTGPILLSLLTLSCGSEPVVLVDAPDFTLKDSYGRELNLKSMRGKAVLLIFWTTWCGVCREQMPVVDSLRAEYRSRGLEVLGVNPQDPAAVREHLTAQSLYLNTVFDPSNEVHQKYRVSGIPTMVLINAAGKIQSRFVGFRSEKQLGEVLASVTAP